MPAIKKSRRSKKSGASGEQNQGLPPTALSNVSLARGRHTSLSKMNPIERGTTLVKHHRSEYIVYGDFVCKEPYTFATSAY